ncbi:MAG: hypothetical protein KDI61_02640 [Alphaproteobacteria bacterium]|nr:hypothetical protein [Alphaproteobacteria bacterium]MCB1839147.1 hypothetical protein [Alphaproteobacteria bacterium]
MSESFLKALRWYFIAACTIIGTTCFMVADHSKSIKLVGPGLLAFGVVYIMTAFWKDVRGKLLAANVGVFFLLTLLSSHVYEILYILFGLQQKSMGIFGNTFFMWGFTEALIGIPIMAVVFLFYD